MEDKIKRYIEFLLKRCLSMNSYEPLVICYSIFQKDFVNLVIEVANKMNINEIHLIENDEDKTKQILESSTIDEIKSNPYFDRSIIKEVYDKKGSILFPHSYEKGKLKDIDEDKIKAMNEVKISTQKDAKDARSKYDFPWCIAAVATKEWADELFPNEENNLEKLWDLIFDITMMNEEEPYKAWEKQILENKEITYMLNNLKLSVLKYNNKIGTDIEIGLPGDVIWCGTDKKSLDGKKDLIVNVPSLEVFTTPNKNKVNGTVVSSKPLILRGSVIDKLKLTFKDGKITDIWASNNEDILRNVINEFDGMDSLGECAFVDYDSLISNTNIVFKTTLIDENASCHFALGSGFESTIPNGENLSEEELIEKGINRSKNHVDFMIGTSDLNIIGTDIYGNEIPIFIDGNFALDKVKSFLKERKDKYE